MIFSRASAFRKFRGFTLTEITIVLGIIGLILGAIWAAARAVYDAQRLEQTVKNADLIAQGYRGLYTKGVDAVDGTDVTCYEINSGLFPADMMRNVTCAAGNTSTYPRHPWAGYVIAYADKTNQAIQLNFVNLPQNACNALSRQLFTQSDVVYNEVNGLSVYLPPFGNNSPLSITQVSGACVNGNNTVIVKYKAR